MKKYKDIIEKYYDIGKVQKLEKLDIKSTNYLYIVETAKEKFLLKKIWEGRSIKKEYLLAEIDIIEHLHSKEFKVILPIKNKNNCYLTVAKAKQYYLLFPFHELDDSSKYKIKHFKESIRILAEFHKKMKNFTTKHKFKTEEPLHTGLRDITHFAIFNDKTKEKSCIDLAKSVNNNFSKKILKDSDFIKTLIIEVINYLHYNKDVYTKTCMLHYDYNQSNLFFKSGNFFALSDFEYSHIGYIETDIAKAAKYWSEDKKKTIIDIKKFKSFVKIYSKYERISTNWHLYYILLIYIVLRRVVYSILATLKGKAKIEFLYDYDVNLLKYLTQNKKIFLGKFYKE